MPQRTGQDLACPTRTSSSPARATATRRAVRTIIRQNNQRLFRLARSIMKDDSEAEDVVQESYVRAFTRLDEFRGESSLEHVADAYRHQRGLWPSAPPAADASSWESVEATPCALEAQIIPFPHSSSQPDPERAMAQHEINQILERAIDALPEPFRVVLVARLVEEMSIEETADIARICGRQTVKTRLHRARVLLRDDLERQVGPMLTDVFPFAGARCERMADASIARLTNRASRPEIPGTFGRRRIQWRCKAGRLLGRQRESSSCYSSESPARSRLCCSLPASRRRKAPSRPIRRSPISPIPPASSTSRPPSRR